ncbi:hypothetical protein ABTE52_22270, partial [Acinetobacter baumannii]
AQPALCGGLFGDQAGAEAGCLGNGGERFGASAGSVGDRKLIASQRHAYSEQKRCRRPLSRTDPFTARTDLSFRPDARAISE